MYKLKRDSLSSRFYSWIWGTDVTKFKTMCPYFWSYAFTILFLPIILAGKFLYYITPAKRKIATGFDYVANTKGGKVLNSVGDKVFGASRFWGAIDSILKWIYISAAVLWLLMLVLILVVKFLENPTKFGIEVLTFVGLITAIFGLVYVTLESNVFDKIKSFFKLIGDMIYSLYKKVCPLIKWEENVSRATD